MQEVNVDEKRLHRLTAYKVVMRPFRSVLGDLSRIPGVTVYVQGIALTGDEATTLAYISIPPDKKVYEAALEELRKHPEVIDYQILSKKNYSLTVAITKNLCEFYRYTLDSGRLTFFPYVHLSGRRRFFILSAEDASRVRTNLSKHGQILSFEKVPLSVALRETEELIVKMSFSEVLSPLQKSVLLEALKLGYYDWPRKITLTELADRLGISKATLSEHLRRAHQKLLTLLIS